MDLEDLFVLMIAFDFEELCNWSYFRVVVLNNVVFLRREKTVVQNPADAIVARMYATPVS